MSHGTTIKVVESAVASLNDKAERLGWLRRYEFHKGNATMGQQHRLVTRLPGQVLAIQSEPIGNTLNKAHRYVQAMNQVLNDATLERARSRAGALTGEHRMYDPNARSNRPGEAV